MTKLQEYLDNRIPSIHTYGWRGSDDKLVMRGDINIECLGELIREEKEMFFVVYDKNGMQHHLTFDNVIDIALLMKDDYAD